jgi:DNA-binding transcriptional LysR family regulator
MFERLFAESGLSLDRIRAFLEVGAAGSIVKAARGDPVRQSLYSRQIKELEDFFQTRLVERQGRGIRVAASGRELARISRFFLLGLSNFQRGCLSADQTFRIGASATVIHCFLLPVLAGLRESRPRARYQVETVSEEEMERRLHDLTLDFAITTASTLSRPLQLIELGRARLVLWVPKALHKTEKLALQAFKAGRLEVVAPTREPHSHQMPAFRGVEPRLVCENFLQARTGLEGQGTAALLPGFLAPKEPRAYLKLASPALDGAVLTYRLAWNPRLIRLNPQMARRRDLLAGSLLAKMKREA